MSRPSFFKQLTLVIIPGANKPVRRVKLPAISFVAAPVAAITVTTAFVATLSIMQIHHQEAEANLEKSFERQKSQLSEVITSQSGELGKLQDELLELTEQANQVKGKLDEIQQLQGVMDRLKEESPHTDTSPPAVTRNGMGGPKVEPDKDQVNRLALQTKDQLQHLLSDAGEIIGDLNEADQRFKQEDYLKAVTPSIWPISSRLVTSRFGVRRDPFTSQISMHTGMDLDGEYGDPVFAGGAGTVEATGWDELHGNFITIRHTPTLQTKYMHLSSILVKPKEQVAKGQTIGKIGSTGRSTGTHLHYEVLKNGNPVDPEPYMKGR